MLIFFGIKKNLLTRTPLEGCTCPNCDNQTLIASKYGSYFHVFFVPFFPTAKFIEVGCYHCNRTYDAKYVSSDIQQAIFTKTFFYNKKRPLWHSLGCMAVLAFILLFVVIMICGITYQLSNPEKKKAVTHDDVAYKADLKSLTSEPNCRVDSISCQLKFYIDSVVVRNRSEFPIDLGKVEYFSKVKTSNTGDSEAIIVLNVDDLDLVAAERRSMIVSYVIDAMEERHYNKRNLYICLRNAGEPAVVYTPTNTELDGYSADDSSLSDFYKD